jgi:hypothetical protein
MDNPKKKSAFGKRCPSCNQGHWHIILIMSLLVLFVLGLGIPIWLDFTKGWKEEEYSGCSERIGIDFLMRYNEMACVRNGVNPCSIRFGKAKSEKYRYYLTPEEYPGQQIIDAYPPWAYTYFGWLTFFSQRTAWKVYFVLMLLALGCVMGAVYKYARKNGHDTWHATCFALGAALLVHYGVSSCFYVGNFGLIIATFLCVFLTAMEHDKPILAALAWAIMMSKPQMAIMLAIPLLLQRKFKICFVALAICLACSIPPGVLSRTNPVELILAIPKFGSDVATQTKLLPGTLMKMMSIWIPMSVINLIQAGFGVILCTILTRRLLTSPWPWLRYLPAVIISNYCLYSLSHNDCTFIVAIGVLLTVIADEGRRELDRWMVLACLCLGCFYLQLVLSHPTWGIVNIFGFSWPETSQLYKVAAYIHHVATWFFLVAFCRILWMLGNSHYSGQRIALTSSQQKTAA